MTIPEGVKRRQVNTGLTEDQTFGKTQATVKRLWFEGQYFHVSTELGNNYKETLESEDRSFLSKGFQHQTYCRFALYEAMGSLDLVVTPN